MLVNLSSEIFEGSEMDFKSLNLLIQLLTYRHRYDFYVDLVQLEGNEFYERLDRADKEIIQEYFNRSINNSDSLFVTVSNKDGDNCCSVEDAIKFLSQPFLLILENSDNDGYFVDALLRCFSNKAKKISRFKNEMWLKYAMGGGADNIIRFVEGEKKNYSGRSDFLRCCVLIDSDKEHPTMGLDKKASLLKYLKVEKISYFVLEKREIENYIPDDVLKSFNDTYLDLYLNMSGVQKDYFDIQKGFDNKPLKSFSSQVQNLYSDIDNDSISILRNGIPDTVVGKQFKSEFPKLFEKATQEGLLNRTKDQNNPNELRDILDKISRLL